MKNTDFDKVFVLDTNVLLHDAQSIFQFENNLIIIPMVVLEELDRFKRNADETGRNSRQISRYLDEIRTTGDIVQGVILKSGGYIKIDPTSFSDKETPDNIIIKTANEQKKIYEGKQVILVSKDINLRIKASVLGIESSDYQHDQVDFDELYSGVITVSVDSSIINTLYSKGSLSVEEIELPQLNPNQYVLLKGSTPSHRAIARFDANKKEILHISTNKKQIWGITSKNLEQTIALDLLLNDDIKLVSLVGKAGTGKTLLAVAAGLHKALDEGVYKKVVVSRPIVPMGKDLGYLPGDLMEKMSPWIKPIMDNIEFLISGNSESTTTSSAKGQDLIDQGMLEIEPLTYIRGRSMPNLYLIIDESQNLSPHEIKTIITRAGEGTKIVLTGDCFQIDNPYIDSSSNGLTYTVDKFKDQAIAGHVTLVKGERSELAEIASNIL